MGKEKIHYFYDSSKILKWPDGSVEVDTLEHLLYNAKKEKLNKSAKIGVTYHERVPYFGPDNENWHDVSHIRTHVGLKRMYHNATGRKYVGQKPVEKKFYPQKGPVILANGIGKSREELKGQENNSYGSYQDALAMMAMMKR